MANDTLYLKVDQNVEVHQKDVFLGDIAELECSNKKILNRLKMTKVITIQDDKRGRYPVSVMRLVKVLSESFPNLDITNMGEQDFLITYEKEKHMHKVLSWIKTILVCFVTFFGAAFSIMAFNNDVDLPTLFGQLYTQFTGQVSDGFTLIEFTYSLGVGLGVILYFNHVSGKRLTTDPTPIEVEMRTYEDDVNKTLIEESRRKEQNANVD